MHETSHLTVTGSTHTHTRLLVHLSLFCNCLSCHPAVYHSHVHEYNHLTLHHKSNFCLQKQQRIVQKMLMRLLTKGNANY